MLLSSLTALLLVSSFSATLQDSNEQLEDDIFHGQFSDPSAKSIINVHIDDMVFINTPGEDSPRDKRNAIRRSYYKWPNARIPYVISSVFSDNDVELIKRGMRHWEDNTCIRFHPRTSERDYVYIIRGDGCYSYVGRISSRRQPQGLSIGNGCMYFSTIVHELGHAIGFYHEHTRPDRNEYIKVNFNNIIRGFDDNFEKYNPGQTDTLGYGYDFASIMHYTSRAFAEDRSIQTITALDEGIVFGSAQELSPLDILKANRLYECENKDPPISTVPNSHALTIPEGMSCGSVVEGKSGTLYSPGYPSSLPNQDCAWVIRVPQGFRLRLRFTNVDQALINSDECTEDYVQVYRGRSMHPDDQFSLSVYARDGKFCQSSQIFNYINMYNDMATVHYHTGNSARSNRPGLIIQYDSYDINECHRNHRCHRCINLQGSYRCECNEGYYHSVASIACFDINECAYNNGGCQHHCDNSGGSYKCLCYSGYYLQLDGVSCSRTPPGNGIIVQPTLQPTTGPLTTVAMTTPTPIQCSESFTASSGVFRTPLWPETYPFNFDCVWTITLPNQNSVVQLSFDNRAFGIAGKAHENCPKDYLKIYDNNILTHTICDLTRPSPITTTSARVRLVFHAGPSHGPLRKGFRITYTEITRATTPPPTTVPLTTVAMTTPQTTTPPPTTVPLTTVAMTTPAPIHCTDSFTASSGVFRTPLWPETYPFNFDCIWTITLPNRNSVVQLSFDNRAFGIAGKAHENCPKDYLKIYDDNILTHTICDLTRPSPITTTSARVRLVFHAGPSHGPLRKGFRITYKEIAPATIPPSPLTCPIPNNIEGRFTCRGLFGVASRPKFGPVGFPAAITAPTTCSWTAIRQSGRKLRVHFMYLDMPESDNCSSGNYISIHRGYTNAGPMVEKLCGRKSCDEYVVEIENEALTVALHVAEPDGAFRGFYAYFSQV